MTKQQKLQAIVEAAGMCWEDKRDIRDDTTGMYYGCWSDSNPSPDSVDALLKIAEKLHMGVTLHIDKVVSRIEADVFDGESNYYYGKADTPAEAMLEALFNAVSRK